jgi:hypothetical protein
MNKTAPFNYRARIAVPNCNICTQSCTVASFWSHWHHRLERTCLEYAAVATELLATKAGTCDEWTRWMRQGAQQLAQALWKSSVQDVDVHLVAAAMRSIHRHARDDDTSDLCRALGNHAPGEGETARIPRAGHPDDKEWPRWAWREASWVRCEKHRTWCAVGLYKDIYGYRMHKRRVLGAHFIASRSQSCEEFHARQTAAVETDCAMRFVPAGRSGRWIRRDQTEEKKITLAYRAASWSDLAPALGPWEAVVTDMLTRRGRNS